MRTDRQTACHAAFALCLVLSGARSAAAWTGNVLIIEGADPVRPLAVQLAAALRESLVAASSEPVSVYYEALDLDRFSEEAHIANVRQFLGDKYRLRRPDVLIPIGNGALRFALALRTAHWPDVPIVFAVTTDATAQEAGRAGLATGIVVRVDAAATLKAAFALLPDTEEVVLVAGSMANLDSVDRVLATLGDRVRVTRLVDLSLDELRSRVTNLPDRSVIVFVEVARDVRGRGFFGRQVLDQISPLASRPIFSMFATFLGHGIVGGSLLEPESIGRELAQLAARVLSGTPPEAIPVTDSRATRFLFDARQLRRWGLDEARLPAGSEVRFRERSLFEEYRNLIIGVAVLLVVQAALIAALLLEVQRRRRAQAQSRQLSARILTAQEEERSRIARELHDDASQQLALLAIDLDRLGMDAEARGEIPGPAQSLAGRVRTLSSGLHQLAYELHPAILDQLGLVPAVRQFSTQFAARHGIQVEVTESTWPADLPDRAALALFRVAQEALQNVVKHSGAAKAHVSLQGSAEGVLLVVSDAGRGFEVTRVPAGPSLGLAGMKERLRLVGGELCVDTKVGGGTVVAAGVSRRALEAMRAAAPSALDLVTAPASARAPQESDGQTPRAAR